MKVNDNGNILAQFQEQPDQKHSYEKWFWWVGIWSKVTKLCNRHRTHKECIFFPIILVYFYVIIFTLFLQLKAASFGHVLCKTRDTC